MYLFDLCYRKNIHLYFTKGKLYILRAARSDGPHEWLRPPSPLAADDSTKHVHAGASRGRGPRLLAAHRNGGGGPSFMLCVRVERNLPARVGKRERKEGGLLKDGCFTCVLGGDAVPQVPSLMIFFCFKGDFVCFSLEHL